MKNGINSFKRFGQIMAMASRPNLAPAVSALHTAPMLTFQRHEPIPQRLAMPRLSTPSMSALTRQFSTLAIQDPSVNHRVNVSLPTIDFAGHLRNAKLYFEQNESRGNYFSGKMQLYRAKLADNSELCIYGIAYSDQQTQDWQATKGLLAQNVGDSSAAKTIQYVGISTPKGYSVEGTQHIESMIDADLEAAQQGGLIFYGGTGFTNPESPADAPRADINGCVNRRLDVLGSAFAKRVFANVVDQSFDVIEKYGASISQQVRNVIYVYGTSEYQTQFGDDNICANSLTDTLKDFSGGPQSLAQVVDVAKRGGHVYSYADVRSELGERSFSSTGFLIALQQLFNAGTPSQEELEKFERAYCRTKGYDAKWDGHTKESQILSAFKTINEMGRSVFDHITTASRKDCHPCPKLR